MSACYPAGKPRKPRLYRLARYLRWASILATVLVIVYIVLAAYSLIFHHPSIEFGGGGSNGGGLFSACANQTQGGISSGYACGFNVTNPGWFSISLQAAFNIQQKNGPLIAHGSSPYVTVAPSSTERFLLSLVILGRPANNSTYIANGWINGSYASLFSLIVTISYQGNFSFPSGGPATPLDIPGPAGPSLAPGHYSGDDPASAMVALCPAYWRGDLWVPWGG